MRSGTTKVILVVLITILFFGLNLRSQIAFFEESDKFFKKYVEDGKVNYAVINNQPDNLKNLKNK